MKFLMNAYGKKDLHVFVFLEGKRYKKTIGKSTVYDYRGLERIRFTRNSDKSWRLDFFGHCLIWSDKLKYFNLNKI